MTRRTTTATTVMADIPADLPVAQTTPQGNVAPYIAISTVEGLPTGDDRFILAGVLGWRDLPQSLKVQHDSDGVEAAIGRTDEITRLTDTLAELNEQGELVLHQMPGVNSIIERGVIDLDDDMGAEAARKMAIRSLRGVSVELCDCTVEPYVWEDDYPVRPATADEMEQWWNEPPGAETLDIRPVFTAATVMSRAFTPTPAFGEAQIALDYSRMEDGLMARITASAKPVTAGAKFRQLPGVRQAGATVVEIPPTRAPSAIVAAAGFPVRPPAEWFQDPQLPGRTRLTLTSEGRVFGHIVTWQDETGRPTVYVGDLGGRTVTANDVRHANIGAFLQGQIECADGTVLDRIGNLMLTGGHADVRASYAEATSHYDNPDAAWAQVTAGYDEHGLWVAGAAKPSLTDEQVRLVRATPPSGHWHPYRGELRLIAVCQVVVPGFGVTDGGRALAASAAFDGDGELLGLVASAPFDLYRDGAGCADCASLRVEMAPVLAAWQQQEKARLLAEIRG